MGSGEIPLRGGTGLFENHQRGVVQVARGALRLSDARFRERKAFGLTENDVGEEGPLVPPLSRVSYVFFNGALVCV